MKNGVKKKIVYANILCDDEYKPFKLIVTNGESTMEIPISNSSLKTVQKAAKQVYGATTIFVSRLMSDGE